MPLFLNKGKTIMGHFLFFMKMSKSAKGKIRSEETKQKMRDAWKRRKQKGN